MVEPINQKINKIAAKKMTIYCQPCKQFSGKTHSTANPHAAAITINRHNKSRIERLINGYQMRLFVV